MIVIRARNVHQALPEALWQLQISGTRRESRNGPVTVFSEPVTTVYAKPEERVLFWAQRDANPFFHFFEQIWMIAGHRDVAFVKQFAANMASFSDDGKNFHAAYGHRWAHHFGMDQLGTIATQLRTNKDDRRCVLQMWDPRADLGQQGKDFPCNLCATFQVNDAGLLDMVVSNRSNDLVWGAYGANAVHFSFLQEFLAAWVGVPIGRYWQVSANLHMYDATRHLVEGLEDCARNERSARGGDPYEDGSVQPFPLVSTGLHTWMEDLALFFVDRPALGYRDPFFNQVVVPLWGAWQAFKNPKLGKVEQCEAALDCVTQCAATDWRMACGQWLERRLQKRRHEQDDGVEHA